MASRRTAARLLGVLALVSLSFVSVAAEATTPHNGYLAPAADQSAGTPSYVVTADFNGDGFDDWATAGGNAVTVMLSNGAGGFSAAPGSPITVSGASHLRTGFVDAGTVPDLVVVSNQPSTTPDTLVTLLGSGAGGFGAPIAGPSLGSQVSTMQVGDVTGDGKLDVVSARIQVDAETHSYPVTVWSGNNAGAFSAVTTVAGASLPNPLQFDGPKTIEMGDMDGDSDLDVVVPNFATLTITVWLNNGSGGLTAATGSPVAAGARPWDLTLADVDTDGDLDALTADPNQPNGSVRILLGNGTGGLTATAPVTTSGMPVYHLEPTDFNDDGITDLVAMSNNYLYSGGSHGRFMTFLGDGAGGFALGWGFGTWELTRPSAVAAGDFTGDGLADLAVTNNTANLVRIYLSVIDDTAPVTTIELTPAEPSLNGWFTQTVQVGWSIVETGSGWAHVKCIVDPWYTPTSYDQLPASFCTNQQLSADGIHHYWVAALDRAGNKEVPHHAEIRIDKTAPVVTLGTQATPSQPGWYDAPLSATVAADDGGISGVAALRCVADPGQVPATYASLPGTCATPFALGEGMHTLYAAATDNAGNTSTVQSRAFNIDTTDPELSPSVTPSTFETGTEEATAAANATDNLSGIKTTTCEPIEQTVGEHVMECTATDNAGNQATAQTTYTVLPHPDAALTLTSAKATGTRVALQATVTTNAQIDVGTLTFTLPSSLRPDVATGCTIDGLTVSCPLDTLATGSTRLVTVLASPRTAGPHGWSASLSLPEPDTDPGNDTATASVGTDVVCDNVPTGSADTAVGTSGADILCGLGGNDTLRGLAGNDLFFGGSGTDLISYAGAPGTWVDLRQQGLGIIGARARSGTGHGQDSFTGIESVLGSAFADLITGSGLVNRLLGGDGADVLSGLGGTDRLEGGAGNDRLTGGAGTDTLIGGAGTDTCRESTDARTGCEI